MKERDCRLTLQETEQLCRLYMDCELSAIQENELRYILFQVDYHSALIDEVRQLMKIELSAFAKTTSEFSRKKNVGRARWRTAYFSAAASIMLLVGVGLSIFYSSSFKNDTKAYYIAYDSGQRLSDEAARAQIEEEMQSAEDFMNEMALLEARENEMIDNFINANSVEQ